MKYLSTRGGPERLSFEEAVIQGLAPNGGLYIPAAIPQLPPNWATEWSSFTFPQLSFQILRRFIPVSASEGGIPDADLKSLIERSYSTFRDPQVSPLVQLADHEWCLELWHGPTFAFKDVALQLVGNLFEYFLQRRNAAKSQGATPDRITVVGATSGDTGSAAIAGLRSKANIDIFILHPKGRVSPIQEAQMTTVLDTNVHNLAVDGTFDDCQDIVKVLFSDKAFNDQYRLGAVNSINFARILAQIVYYFSAYFQLQKQLGLSTASSFPPEIQFVVPTGNFGDVLAGYYAKRMGMPVQNLAVATNENDILQRFWKSGAYEKNSASSQSGHTSMSQVELAQSSLDSAAGGVKATLSPAMDILVSSNFERLLWYLVFETDTSGSDEERASRAGEQIGNWMKDLKEKGRFAVSEEQHKLARRDFSAERVSDSETKKTILKYFSSPPSAMHRKSYLVDPHTAVGMCAANRLVSSNRSATHQIILSTAHPAKFSEAVVSSLESAGAQFDFDRDVLPPEMHGLLEKERRVIDVKLGQQGGFESLVENTKAVIEKTVGASQAQSQANGAVTASS
ncbi:putative THR4-threonine synthase [Tilletiaria anomala UBC 951]|uniref:threonine synthase n=1 Tax=Tilletiaria anomala (strain ATCC 24038 / CBS 436.72 / UBC 951) TaxID=1037660 RepID=A0A066WGM9_TILAU|nr:putative THR4-threonine synthase [Tilletiaria anomala UBC 951]KDN53157.1 putative THR4-threonine synthase [Tilletiaria anomala UBC 951]